MGQYWKLILLDSYKASWCLGKMREMLSGKFPQFIDLLLTLSHFPMYPPISVKRIENYQSKDFSFVEKMTDEILDKICQYLASGDDDNDDDVLSFAFSCYRFIRIGWRRLYLKYRVPIWYSEGERLITVGDYVEDYPKDVLTEKEEKIMRQKTLYKYADNLENPISCYYYSRTPYNRACAYLRNNMKDLELPISFPPFTLPTYTRDSKFILLNTTTYEYVRASDIPEDCDIRFGHIVLLQTCWSSDPSMSISYGEEFYRGPWAGHRLVITTIDRIFKDAKDVSKEVLSKIVKVFAREKAQAS